MVARRAQASSLIYCLGPPTTRIRMAQDSIAVLLVEDDLAYARFATQTIAEVAPEYLVVHVPALAAALDALHRARFDAVLLDLGLPDSEGLATLDAVARAVPALPIVVLTARSDQQLSRAALRQGAQDYVVKGETEPNHLARSLRYAIDRTRAITAVERRLRLLNDASDLLEERDYDTMLARVARLVVSSFAEICVMFRLNPGGSVEEMHLAHVRGDREPDLQALEDALRDVATPIPSDYLPTILEGRSLVLDGGNDLVARQVLHSDAALAAYRRLGVGSIMLVPIATGAALSGLMILASSRSAPPFDATDVAMAEDLARRAALAIENGRLVREARELFDADLTGNFVAGVDGTLTDCNPAFARMLGYDSVPEAVHGGALAIFGGDVGWRGFVGNVVRDRRVRQHEIALRSREGSAVHVLVSATGIFSERGQLATIRGQLYDLTAHKQLEEQLSQSQKMEAVGRLAGGIAHDFNNLLMVIGGQTGRLLEQLPEAHALRRNAEAIAAAADRAAGLTQQLLAFSRRQVLSPQVLSLNTVVRSIYGMLERVIGEDITCVLSLSEGIESVKADPGRIEQALLNLAVNARDAMPDGGTLAISTSVVELDEVYSRQHIGSRPGRYVMLAVSDTGCGMDPETRTRVFEPFFTTKEVGKGTGLGLSMVYGIVKQSGGYIWVYSELGLGTTFKIYLPATEAPPETLQPRPAPSVPTGTETILLVEDEDGVRELLEEILSAQGYRVLAASRGVEALQISELLDEEIQVLVTDVVMPHMSGHELAMRLRARRPALRVLYLSGYTDDAIAHHGIVEVDASFLQKPFTRAALATKVREVLAPRSEP
jgi:PAS domain S-box-containing protein